MKRRIMYILVLIALLATQTVAANTGAENASTSTTTGYWIHGIITLDMGKNEDIIDGSGNDLWIQEIPRTEPFDVYVSKDLKNWFLVADDIETGLDPPKSWVEVDISPSGLTSARYVKIVDESTLYAWALKVPGSDIDAVKALHCMGGDPYADAVIFKQTKILDLSGNNAYKDPTKALGAPDWDFVSLGGKHYIEQELKTEINFYPKALNLKSKGRFVMVYIELSDSSNVRNIDASTILLNSVIPPVLDPKYGFVTSEKLYITDHDNDGKIEMMVKFDRRAVCNILESGNEVKIMITGKLNDGSMFGGSDTIKAI
jgi:hypothetical protein